MDREKMIMINKICNVLMQENYDDINFKDLKRFLNLLDTTTLGDIMVDLKWELKVSDKDE